MDPATRADAIAKLREQMQHDVAADSATLDKLDAYANQVAGQCVAVGAGVTLKRPLLKSYQCDGESVALEVGDSDGRTITCTWKLASLTKEWARLLASVSVALEAAAPVAKRLAALGVRA